MSQRAIESALGKLICDDAFRREFLTDPESAVVRAGFQLTPIELSCLSKIEAAAIEGFAFQIDDRIRRAEEPVASQSPDTRQTGPQRTRT